MTAPSAITASQRDRRGQRGVAAATGGGVASAAVADAQKGGGQQDGSAEAGSEPLPHAASETVEQGGQLDVSVQGSIVEIVRVENGHAEPAHDELSVEEPLEIRLRGRALSVTMRTPGHDAELAAGFLLTEGVIRERSDLRKIEPCVRNEDGNVINVFLAPHVAVDFSKLTRHVFASSSCGLCGKATIESVQASFPPIDVPQVSRLRYGKSRRARLRLPSRRSFACRIRCARPRPPSPVPAASTPRRSSPAAES